MSTTARGVAERLWPGSDPVDFARREAIGHFCDSDRALQSAVELREAANEIVFPDFSRLWIHPSRTEILLGLQLASLRDAVRHLSDALELLARARLENDLRLRDEQVRNREERQAAR